MSTATLTRPETRLTPARPVEPPTGEVRLTRRGRVLVVALALTAILAIGLTLSATSVASERSEGFPTRVITVAPGDTLWEIAGDVPGSDSTRSKVTTIEQLNELDGGSLQAGQRLIIPLQ